VTRPFKLEAVLNHRRHREEAARKRYADAVRDLRQQQERLAEMEKMRREYRQVLRHKQLNGDAAAEILLYTRYLTRLDSEVHAQEKIVREHMKEKEEQRQALMVALKDRKVIEKLKEHHLSQMEIEERAAEQKILNDVAITRYQHAEKDV
jgi:flagellar protein FliJ